MKNPFNIKDEDWQEILVREKEFQDLIHLWESRKSLPIDAERLFWFLFPIFQVSIAMFMPYLNKKEIEGILKKNVDLAHQLYQQQLEDLRKNKKK